MASEQIPLPNTNSTSASPTGKFYLRRRWAFTVGIILLLLASLLYFYSLNFSQRPIIGGGNLTEKPTSPKQSNEDAKGNFDKIRRINAASQNFEQQTEKTVSPAKLISDFIAAGFAAQKTYLMAGTVPDETQEEPAASNQTEKDKKPNVFQRFFKWLRKLFRGKKPPVTNLPPSIQGVSLSESEIYMLCSFGQKPRSGQCNDNSTVSVNTAATDADGDTLQYQYTVSGGRIVGSGTNVTWDLSSTGEGTYTITVSVDDGYCQANCGQPLTREVSVKSCDCVPIQQFLICPRDFKVRGSPNSVKVGETITFVADVDSKDNNLTYNWSVSRGEIEGQGTAVISVLATEEMAGSDIMATVELGGLGSDCEKIRQDFVTVKKRDQNAGVFGTIMVRVTGDGQTPIGNVAVNVSPPDDSAGNLRTSPAGIVMFKDLSAGPHTVSVAGCSQQAQPVLITSDQSDFQLSFSCPNLLPVPTPTREISPSPSPSSAPTPSPSPDESVTPTPSPTPAHAEKAGYDLVTLETQEPFLRDAKNIVSLDLDKVLSESNFTVVNQTPNNIYADSNVVTTNVNRPTTTGSGTLKDKTIENICQDDKCFVTADLIIDGRLEIESRSGGRVEYDGEKPLHWEWNLKPLVEDGQKIGFAFKLTVEAESRETSKILRSKNVLPAEFNEPFREINVGLPASIIAAKWGAGASILGAFLFLAGSVGVQEHTEDEIVMSDGAGDTPQEEVQCTAYAASKVQAGSDFVVQIFAHLAGQIENLTAMAKRVDATAAAPISDQITEKIKRGATLSFRLVIESLGIDKQSDSHIWGGDIIHERFIVSVPENQNASEKWCKIYLVEDSVPVGSLMFKIEIVSADAQLKETPPQPVEAFTRFQNPFISYSTKDRPQVLMRVQMLDVEKKNYFMDVLDIERGANWAQTIEENINKCDVFYLFWSENAKNSVEVKEEVLMAFSRQGGIETAPPDIIPIPLGKPPPVQPPDELKFLQFNDTFSYLIFAAEAENKALKARSWLSKLYFWKGN
ncbi:MAG TPA: TIR domain-containing protein [Pyrinomonadaceae bacterium]|jgi:hypothetical protein